MCYPLLLGIKYTSCQCFLPLRKEFVDCLSETCTSSLCHPYECVGYLCTCTRVWEGEQLRVVRWEEGVCAACWEGEVRPFSPQRIYHKRVLSPALHEMSARYSTMTPSYPPPTPTHSRPLTRPRAPFQTSRSSSQSSKSPTTPAPPPPPAANRSRLTPLSRNTSRTSGRSASLADYGYSFPPVPRLGEIREELSPPSSPSDDNDYGERMGAGAGVGVYKGDYEVRPDRKRRFGFGYVREAVERSLSSGQSGGRRWGKF
ncbi:hypothetical protein DACRYDRAFT_97537 [Dacryopinax primogenitus]|uniref:Uncharacterized protein n=1 Tax=Dacryopinax primogenitus (strain DJM 731) TaxID=1858805 RepID=M5FTS9_DACPD|nr:uncharacterized protein DACRYDRAFT_97537 [Dacryopinax primogenitus]EJT96631.1 hypothetical protein DACRYDRAFT_97537 [Dacryopinax primogenitus]